jgi:hypothetical protein
MSGRKAKLQRKLDNAGAARDWSALDLRMLRDDVNWIVSLGEASQTSRHWQSIVGLVLTPHMARIVYEGMDLLGRRRPAQATAVKLEFGPQLEAARHTVKLLDDTQKLYEGVVQDFERIDDEHSETFGHLAATMRLAFGTVGYFQPLVLPNPAVGAVHCANRHRG